MTMMNQKRIVWDSNQWIVQIGRISTKGKSRGELYWVPWKYYLTLQAAAKAVLDEEVRAELEAQGIYRISTNELQVLDYAVREAEKRVVGMVRDAGKP